MPLPGEVGHGSRDEPDAIILEKEHYGSVLLFELHPSMGGVGVFGYVGERFLCDAIENGLELGVEAFGEVGFDGAIYLRPLPEGLYLVPQGGLEAALVERRRAQRRHEAPKSLDVVRQRLLKGCQHVRGVPDLTLLEAKARQEEQARAAVAAREAAAAAETAVAAARSKEAAKAAALAA